MIIEILKRSMLGVAFGGIFTFIALTIMIFNDVEATVLEIWMNMGASFLLGIYFGISSLIFGNDDNNIMKKTVLHFFLTYIAWLIIAGTVGWIPLNWTAVLWSTLIFILIYAVNSLGWYLYFKKMETTLNDHLPNNKE